MIPLPDGSTNWFVEGILFPKATYFFESTGAGTRTCSGWARVSAPECAAFENAFANCGAGLDGVDRTLIFRNETRPGFSFESSIPLDSYENHSPVSFPFDNQNGKVSPFSVLKPFINTGERLRVNVSDENGGTVAEQFIDLAPRGTKLFCSPTFFRLPRIEEGPCGYQLKREQGL